MKKHGGMYDESPQLKHSEEGHVKVEKSKKDNTESDKGAKDEGYPVHIRHAHERHTMHAKHEHEHAHHDHHEEGDKKELHARHEKERHEMHTRHEKESGDMGGKEAGAGGSEGEPIDKIEKNAKG